MVFNNQELEVTNVEFEKIINNNSKKIVVVDFFAEWCMPCLMLSPIIDDLSSNFKEAKFVKINVDDNSEISNKYKISTLPCIVAFKSGKEFCRIVGTRSADFIENKIRECLD